MCLGWYALNFGLLYEVSHCLGLDKSDDPNSIMYRDRTGVDLRSDYGLKADDIIGIKVLYTVESSIDHQSKRCIMYDMTIS